MAPGRDEAEKAFNLFIDSYQAKYREALLACYDFPAEHWVHIRTTNPIESPFFDNYSFLVGLCPTPRGFSRGSFRWPLEPNKVHVFRPLK